MWMLNMKAIRKGAYNKKRFVGYKFRHMLKVEFLSDK